MKAFQFVELQKPAELREVKVPEPGPGQVLIKIGSAGACHSDLHILETPAGTPSLGHVTIVGLGGGALPVNFHSPAQECSVASPYWGSIPVLLEVISLAQAGKIRMLVKQFPLERAREAYHLLGHGKIQGRAVIVPNG